MREYINRPNFATMNFAIIFVVFICMAACQLAKCNLIFWLFEMSKKLGAKSCYSLRIYKPT